MSSVKTKRGDGSAKMVKTMRRTTYLVILVAVCAFPPAVYFAAQRLSHPQDMWYAFFNIYNFSTVLFLKSCCRLFGAHPNKFNFLNDAGPLVTVFYIMLFFEICGQVLTVSIVICMVWWVWVPSSTSSPLSETFLQEVEVNRNFSAVVTPSRYELREYIMSKYKILSHIIRLVSAHSRTVRKLRKWRTRI